MDNESSVGVNPTNKSETYHEGVSPVIKLPVWKNLVESAQNWEYGSLHSFDEISTILNLAYGESAFRTAVARANEELTPMGKRLKNIRGEGYEVLKAEEYLGEAVYHISKAARQIKRGYNIAAGCKLDLLTQDQRKEINDFKDWSRSQLVEKVSDISHWLKIAKSTDIPMLPRRS